MIRKERNKRYRFQSPDESTTRVVHEHALERESCLVQLVELEPPRVNERSTVVVCDDANDNDDDDDDGGDEDDEEGGAFLSMGRNFLVASYLHIISRNSRMCLIRRYLSSCLAVAINANRTC